jgi:hypothetical protein
MHIPGIPVLFEIRKKYGKDTEFFFYFVDHCWGEKLAVAYCKGAG